MSVIIDGYNLPEETKYHFKEKSQIWLVNILLGFNSFFKIKYGEDEFVITIVIVEGDVVLEDVCSTLHWHDIVDNKFAKSGKEISSLVQFLNLRVVVHLIVFLVDEDVILNEVIDQLHHCRISLYSSDANMHTISFKVTFNEIGYI